jgi:hypothetical protein
MLKIFKESILKDLKNIFSNYRLLIALLILVWLSFLHTLLFPVFSDYFFSKSGLRLEEYYALFTVTCISVVPALIGTLYGKILREEESQLPSERPPENQRTLLFARIVNAVVLTFIITLVSVIIIKPVHAQGWLRNLSAAMLLSVQAAIVLLYIAISGKSGYGRFYKLITYFLLLSLPLGLLFHHPWNYPAFLSPFYWIGWEWLIVSPTESLLYGVIALVMTSSALFLLLRKYFREFNVS